MLTRQRLIITFTFFALLAVVGPQFIIALNSKSQSSSTQDVLREVARLWADQKSLSKDTFDIRSPIGLTTLGCRYWAFDFYRGNCYGLIVYTETVLPSERRESLFNAIMRPCQFLNQVTQQSEKANSLRSNLACSSPHRSPFRLTVSFQRVNRIVQASGHVTNEFFEIDSLTLKGVL
jgi:hypothetical protein